MFHFNNDSKKRRIVIWIIVGLIVLAMVLPLVLSAINY